MNMKYINMRYQYELCALLTLSTPSDISNSADPGQRAPIDAF